MNIQIDITPPKLKLNKQKQEHLQNELNKICTEIRKQAEKDIEKMFYQECIQEHTISREDMIQLYKKYPTYYKLYNNEFKLCEKIDDNMFEEPTKIETITYNYAESYDEYNIKEQMYINQLKEVLHLPTITEIVVMQDTGLHIRGLITVKEDILLNLIKQLRKICSTIDVNIQEDSISIIAYFKEEYKT